MRVRLASPAQADLIDALEWYAAIQPGLARRLLDDIEALVEALAENPLRFPAVRGAVRRAGLRHFPYALFYRVIADEVEIVACFHSSRSPRRWQDRT